MPSAMSRNAESRFDHFVTGLPSVGRASNFAKGASFQSTGRRITGTTLAAPDSCICIARSISLP